MASVIPMVPLRGAKDKRLVAHLVSAYGIHGHLWRLLWGSLGA